MAKVRIPITGTVGKSVNIDTDATKGATIGTDLKLPSGKVGTLAELKALFATVVTGGSSTTPGLASTLWRLIGEIPANISALAALATTGIMARTGAGTFATRTLTGTATRIDITNGNGVAGNPTFDLADLTSVSVWGRAANTAGKPASIQAAANDRLLARTADQITFRQLTVGMIPNDEITYAKIQNVSATNRILGRITALAGDIEELTGTQATTLLDAFTATLKGLVPPPVTATGKFLKDDGTWAAPASGAANITADTHPTSPSLADDEFEVGSTIDTAGTRVSGATPWTAFNVGTGTSAVGQGALRLSPALTASATSGGYTQPVTGTWGYTLKISTSNGNANSLIGIFVGVAAAAAGKMMIIGLSNLTVLIVQKRNTATSFNVNTVTQTTGIAASAGNGSMEMYLRIGYNGTTLVFQASSTGIEGSFVTLLSEASATFLGTPALIGITGDTGSASIQAVGVFDWFRKTA